MEQWTLLTLALAKAGFSVGESCIMAAVVVLIFRLQLRTKALADDRFRLWTRLQEVQVQLQLAITEKMQEHQRSLHAQQPEQN